MIDFINQKIKEIKEQVQDEQVLLALSGGVDSSVCAALLSKAIGKNLTCVFVNHGLLRKDEEKEVINAFNDKVNLVYIDASERFLKALEGITNPEEKRKIIGKTFIDVFSEYKTSKYKFLAQGTIYADIVESKKENVIKSHHNVGGLPDEMSFTLIEPLKDLYKYQVREVGLLLGLSVDIVYRQPFPGPGLGVRIVGEITKERLRLVRESDYILREVVKQHNLNIWQYFTVLPNIKTVGIKDNKRCYEDVIVIRCVNSIDGMSAKSYYLSEEVVETLVKRITSEVSGINRVCLDVTPKPPGTIEWE